jgi:hypothetical protein
MTRNLKVTMRILNLDNPNPESHLFSRQFRPLPRAKRRKPSISIPRKRKDTVNSAGKITMARDPTVTITAEIVNEATVAKTEETTIMAGSDKKMATTATTTKVATTRTVIGTTTAGKAVSPAQATINNATTTAITIIDLTSSATGHPASTKSASTSQRWTPTRTIDSITVMTPNSS